MKRRMMKIKPRGRLFLSVLITYLLLLAITFSLLAAGYGYSFQQSVKDREALQVAFLDLMDCLLVILYKISNYIGVEFFGCTCFQLSLLYIEFA